MKTDRFGDGEAVSGCRNCTNVGPFDAYHLDRRAHLQAQGYRWASGVAPDGTVALPMLSDREPAAAPTDVGQEAEI